MALARELTNELSRLGPSQEPAAVRVGRLLSREWACDMIAYRPCIGTSGTWTFEFMEGTGTTGRADVHAAMRQLVDRVPTAWGWGSPLRVDPAWQNRTVVARKMPSFYTAETSPSPIVRELYPRFGLIDRDHVRVNVCDGPVLLAYIGLWRDDPFDAEEIAAFEAIIPAVRARLRIERLLDGAPADLEAMVTALDNVTAPTFLLRGDGRIDLANQAGVMLLAQQPATAAELRDATTGKQPSERIEVTRMASSGLGPRFLTVVRAPRSERATRIAEAVRRWALSARQANVLAHVVHGDSNKEIAGRLGLSEVTIESHVTAILRKVGVESRARLVATYWTLDL